MFKQIIVFVFVFHLSCATPAEQSDNKNDHDCGSDIFCHGDMLETIQLSEVYGDDSEQFVKKKLLHSPDDVWKKFKVLKENNEDLKNNVGELRNFLSENFDEDPLKPWPLSDYKEIENPQNIVRDKTYLKFYQTMDSKWANLGVRTNPIPKEVSDRHSMIALQNYFIKTADSQNFPEVWQNYLIVRGLLWNDMFKSALNIIENMAELSKSRDFIPLTNRVYATKRHQLPLLSFMMDDYLQAYVEDKTTYDTGFLQKMCPVVEAELKWWIENAGAEIKKDDGTNYSLFKYTSIGHEPRPEKYKQDHKLAEKLPSEKEKIRFYSAVRASDETTFGYSSRFMQNKNYPEARLNLEVDRYVPVELNSVLQRCAHVLSDWFFRLGKAEAATYGKLAKDIQYGIDNVLWSKEHKIWLDYDLQTKENVNRFYITNLSPLFTLSYNKQQHDPTPHVLNYLLKEKIISVDDDSNYDFTYNAIPTSNVESEEISDRPYGSIFWNFLIIDGLRETNSDHAKQVAQKMAAALVRTIHDEYERHQTLFENYRVDGSIQTDEIEKLKKNSSSTLGALTTLLRWYGTEIRYAIDDTPSGIAETTDSAEGLNESNMSLSTDDIDVSSAKRPIDISTVTNEDNPDMSPEETSEGKKRRTGKSIVDGKNGDE